MNILNHKPKNLNNTSFLEIIAKCEALLYKINKNYIFSLHIKKQLIPPK